MDVLWSELLTCLDLHPRLSAPTFAGNDDGGSAVGDRRATLVVFEAPNQQIGYRRLFGGQLLAQFVRAAGVACRDKVVKSAHVVFAREGKNDEPVRYIVQRHHEGRSFATLAIVARQKSGVVATASVSMHAVETGIEHQVVDEVPPVLDAEHEVRLSVIPWQTRATTDLNDTAASPPNYDMWMRTPEVDAALAPALTAYASDLNLIGTALRPLEGFSQGGNGTAFTSATISHTLWFHRPFRTDDWLLLRNHAPLVAHGRCFGRGDILTADGVLVASFAQEGLLRFRP
ncbi:acyl-CoA thioesterase [Nocardia callitridis]|uniref:Acyl-CoA thioesterase II n=1 Tax=Nocardia callitridis TaxID=648753 RepID=A0ABP9K8N7_9NOCA